MKIAHSLGVSLAVGTLAWGPQALSSSPYPGQEPVRGRDGAGFRARAAADGTLLQLCDHRSRFPGATALCWSPDSRQLLVLSGYGDHFLIDATSGRVLKTLPDPEEVSHSGAATWTARGTLLLEGYGEDTLFREAPGGDWGAGQELSRLGGLELLGASSNGAWAVMQGDGERHLLDLSTMELLGLKPTGDDVEVWRQGLAIAPDGSYLAWPAADEKGPFVDLVAVPGSATGAMVSTRLDVVMDSLESDDSVIDEAQLAFARGHGLLACLVSGEMLLMDVADGTVAGRGWVGSGFDPHLGAAGDHMVTLDSEGHMRCWSTPALDLLGEVSGFGEAFAMEVSPDGAKAAVLGADGDLDFVRISPQGQLSLERVKRRDPVAGRATVAFFGTEPGELLLGTMDGRVLRVDVATFEAVEVPCRGEELSDEVEGFAEWPLGSRIAIQLDGSRYVDKRARGGAARANVSEFPFGYGAPAASADGGSLLMNTWDDTLEFRTGMADARVIPAPATASSMALSPSGQKAAIVSESELWIYDTREMSLLYRGGADGIPGIGREDCDVDSVGGFLDEVHVAVQYLDGSVRLVDTGGEVASELFETEDFSFLMSYVAPIVSRDGRWLLSTGSDEGLRIFDLDSETLELVLAGDAWTEGVKGWSLSADGAHLAVVTEARAVELWDFPGLMDLAGRMARGEEPAEPWGTPFAGEVADRALRAGEFLRKQGRKDEALAQYILAEAACPLEKDAMGARDVQRRILAGVARCGADAVGWLAVRKARGEHRASAARWGMQGYREFSSDAERLATLMDPTREPASRGVDGSVAKGLLGALRTPDFKRSIMLQASGAAHVEVWQAAVAEGGESAGLRARFRALDQLSLEPAGPQRAALLGQLTPGGPGEEALGQAWWELGAAMADAGWDLAARGAREQSRVWRREATADPADPAEPLPARGVGSSRLIRGIEMGPRDVKRAQDVLEWVESGEWLAEECGGKLVESVMNYAFVAAGRVRIAKALRPGERTLVVRARWLGERQVGAAFGTEGIEVGCRMDGPVMQVRAVHRATGEEVLKGACLLAGPSWAPVDIAISVNAARSEITVRTGEAEALRGQVPPGGVDGAVQLVFSGLDSDGELAVQGYRLE